jgi:hypothetical protein
VTGFEALKSIRARYADSQERSDARRLKDEQDARAEAVTRFVMVMVLMLGIAAFVLVRLVTS